MTGRGERTDGGRDEALTALDFFAEAGLLKKVRRSGWWVAGIAEPESVAEHSFRTAVIGYHLAVREGLDPFKVVMMALFNDIHEARINDLHKMGHFYIDFKAAERRVFRDQVARLDPEVRRRMTSLRREYDAQESRESLAARDADILECLIQAAEYVQEGFPKAALFLKKAPRHLKTDEARRLWGALRKGWDSSRWWRDVVKFER